MTEDCHRHKISRTLFVVGTCARAHTHTHTHTRALIRICMLYLFDEYKSLGKCVKSFKENKFYEKEKLMSRNRNVEIVLRP